MPKEPGPARHDARFSTAEIGPFADLGDYTFAHPQLGVDVEGKVFLNQLLGLTGAEISFNRLPAGKPIPFYHTHRLNEEIYIFLKGTGEFQVDDKVFPVREGTVVRIAPDGVRTWRNNSAEDLFYIVIQAKAGTFEGHTTLDGVGVAKRVSWVKKDAF
jgi:mannose-6-phosphate isomerase-like protein (cupin superfamily)